MEFNLSFTPEQIQQLYAQQQNGGVTPNLGMGQSQPGLFGPWQRQQQQPSSNYGALYQNWVSSLLAPYMKQYGGTPQSSTPGQYGALYQSLLNR